MHGKAACPDIRRARRHRTRHRDCRVAAPQGSEASAVLSARRPRLISPAAPRRSGCKVRIRRRRRRRRLLGIPRCLARGVHRREGAPRSPASRMAPARKRRSPRSARPSAMSPPDAPQPSSPIRSPRACSIAPASIIPAIPNFSPSSPARRRAPQPVMMLWSPALAVVPVTIHLALREAIAQLTQRADRRHRPHRGRRSEGALRHRPPAAGDLRPQSACRRIRHARQRGRRDRFAGGCGLAQRRHRRARPAARRHHVPRSGPQDL